MNPNSKSGPNAHHPNAHEQGTETLRLLATLPPPEGLEDRVHRRLAAAPRKSAAGSWLPALFASPLRFAAAGVVLAAAAAGSWSVYHASHTASPIVNPVAHQAQPVVAPPHQPAAGGFDSAHGMHVPPTLAPIHVPPAPKKKLKPHAAKAAAAQPESQDATGQIKP